MIKTGHLYICDRCGKEEFIENPCNRNIVSRIPDQSWSSRYGMLLCEVCTREFEKFMKVGENDAE